MQLNLSWRKKLTMAIIGVVITWVTTWLAQKGIELTPEQKIDLYQYAEAITAAIIGLFCLAQGIADRGKEVPKALLVFFLSGALFFSPVLTTLSMAQDPIEDLKACEDLLDECADNNTDCDDTVVACQKLLSKCEATCKNCTWKEIITDQKFRAAAIGGTLTLIGGLVTIFSGIGR